MKRTKRIKRIKRRVTLVLGIICTAIAITSCREEKKEENFVNRIGYALNTQIEITIYGTDDEQLITDCFALCTKYEKLFSRTMENSEISLLNEKGEQIVSDETVELLQKGLYYSELSKGAFDITIEPVSSLWDFTSGKNELPDSELIKNGLQYIDYKKVCLKENKVSFDKGMGIDLGAIAKGYIADRLKEYLQSQGVKSAYINLGGNVLCIGGKLSGEDFAIGIRDPKSSANKPIVGVLVSDKSVVTSGTYERYIVVDGKKYHHILNPKTGYSCENDLDSVTIISEKSVDGDGLSTTCFALGLEEGVKLIDSIDNVWAMFIDKDGNITYTEGFKENIPCKEY